MYDLLSSITTLLNQHQRNYFSYQGRSEVSQSCDEWLGHWYDEKIQKAVVVMIVHGSGPEYIKISSRRHHVYHNRFIVGSQPLRFAMSRIKFSIGITHL